MYEYSHDKKVHKKKLLKADDYHKEALLTKSIVSFDHYRKVSLDIKRYQQVQISIMDSFNLKRCFTEYRQVVKNLQMCR